MKDLLIVFGVIAATLIGGALLYFNGPLTFSGLFAPAAHAPAVRVLKEGQDATSMTDRANYRITDGTQLNQLWGMIDTLPNAAPNIDFTKEEVLAVFDGTHTTGGYRIAVTGFKDENGMRTVQVTRYEPGAHCVTTPAITSPYQILAVPKSGLTLTHADTTQTLDCP